MKGKAGADFSTIVTNPSIALDAIAPVAVTIGAAAERADIAAAREVESASSVRVVNADPVERNATSVLSEIAESEDVVLDSTCA
jgi:hypothetical protein